jgi:iron complex outermembrane receptor protein
MGEKRMTYKGMNCALGTGWRTALLAGVALGCFSGSAQAQSESSQEGGLSANAIIVTAERRATNLQDTPLSILAITSEMVEAKGIEDLQDLATYSPNLAITPTRGGGNNTASFVIRGVGGGGGATGERGVGLYIDGIYMPRTNGAVLSVIDIDRVEVLRGPQGTLFGRNSTGGAIRIFSKQPTDQFEGYVRGTVGNLDRADVAATVNVPLAEGFAVRGQAAYIRKGGYVSRGTEMLGREEDFVGRIQARLEPSDRFEATLGFLYTKSKSNGTPLVFAEFDMRPGIEGVIQGNYADWINDSFKAAGQAPLQAYNDPRIVRGPYEATDICLIDDFDPDYSSDCNQELKNRFMQADLKMVYDLSDAASITSISGFSKLKYRGFSDYQVLGTEQRTENVDSEVFYQELQLNLELLNGAIDMVAGASYFHEDSAAPNVNFTRRGTSVYPSNPGTPPNANLGLFRITDGIVEQISESWGLFLSATWHVTDSLNITGGLRQAFDAKDYSQTRYPATDFTPAPGTTSTTVQADDTFKALDWRGTVDYKFTDDIMVYATASKAYKAGSYSYTIASWTPANQATGANQSLGVFPVPNEKVVNYEAGLRMTLFDRLRLNPTIFMMDFTNRQAGVQVACGSAALPNIPAGSAQCPVGFVIQVRNQGDVKLKGFELDGQLLISDDLSIDGGFAVTDPTLKNAPAGTVNLFPDVPSPTWNIGATFSPDTPIGELVLNASYARVGPQETHPSTGTDSSYLLPGYGLLNARARLKLEGAPVTLSVYANNLLDTVYATYAQRFGGGYWDSPAGTGLAAPLRSALSEVRGRPREVGLTVQFDF